jgi:hypothetical protein
MAKSQPPSLMKLTILLILKGKTEVKLNPMGMKIPIAQPK